MTNDATTHEKTSKHDTHDLSDPIVTRLAELDETPWYKKPNLRLLYLLMFPTCIGVEMTSGFDSSMINGLQAVDSWDTFFHSPRSTLLGLISAMYSLGAIIVLPIVPVITDRLGRRHAISFGSLLMVIGAALQTGSQNSGYYWIPIQLLLLYRYSKHFAALVINLTKFPFAGAIVAAGVTLGTFNMNNNWGWRIPSLLQVVPSALQLTFIYFMPESPRWLISKGRGEEARAILVKYHAEGDEASEFVKAEFVQIEKTLELEKETEKVGWLQLVATAGMRRRMLVGAFLGLATQWSGNGLTSYFLARILDNVGVHDNRTKNVINLGITCWGFFNATIFALISSRFKRRIMYLGVKRPLALSSPFLVEIFPFKVRAKGISVFQWFSRAAGFFNQFVNPIGIANAGWKYYISYCIFLLFEVLFVYFLFPETHGRTLEELAFLYEDDKVIEQKKRVEEDIHNEENRNEKDAHIDERSEKRV
ncbi:hypothetical protein C0995_003044 [Termitomyces sp. Mi166|nr:hypothetical protein C0995_003044 [Termitomyces sp. Mi166\